MENEEIKKLKETIIEACHIVGKLKNENDELREKLQDDSEAIKLLAGRTDKKCSICKFKSETCVDCSFVYEHDDRFNE